MRRKGRKMHKKEKTKRKLVRRGDTERKERKPGD